MDLETFVYWIGVSEAMCTLFLVVLILLGVIVIINVFICLAKPKGWEEVRMINRGMRTLLIVSSVALVLIPSKTALWAYVAINYPETKPISDTKDCDGFR